MTPVQTNFHNVKKGDTITFDGEAGFTVVSVKGDNMRLRYVRADKYERRDTVSYSVAHVNGAISQGVWGLKYPPIATTATR